MVAVSFKAWLAHQAMLGGVSMAAIARRYDRGKYPGMVRRKFNRQSYSILVPKALAIIIEPPTKFRPPLVNDKKNAPLQKNKMCACGNIALRNRSGSHICARCIAIEHRTKNDYIRVKPATGGLTEHVLHLR
jgi:hypothetical protein